MPPDPTRAELVRALAVFAEGPTAEHAAVAQALELGQAPDGEEHARLFAFQLYPYASVHLGPEGMMGGEAADRVAGFWRAMGQTPPAEPDHLSALLGLYATLLHGEEEVGVLPRAALLHEHIAPWVFSFLDRVEALGSPFYRRWAVLLRQVLEAEVPREPALDTVPVHLTEAPGLPDPRDGDAAAFVEGLLAPVRTGMILARADLTRMARALDVGVRIGERRFILDHLLAQEPVGTLEVLAEEAERWAQRHRERLSLLGVGGPFWVERAEATATLLRALSAEGAAMLDQEMETRP